MTSSLDVPHFHSEDTAYANEEEREGLDVSRHGEHGSNDAIRG